MNAAVVSLIIREVASEIRFNFAPDSRSFDCKFIEPGIVSYRDVKGGGIELLRKETIDRAIATAVGNALTVGHVIVTAENRMAVENGIVTDFYFDANDGWYHVKGYADTEEAKSRIRRGFKPSCGYIVKSFGPGGMYHGIRYDKEITEIEFNHLAIVDKPRYEDAVFRLNSVSIVSPTNMNVFKFLKKLVTRENGADGKATESTKVESHEVSGETEVVIDGKPVKLNSLVEAHRANSAPEALTVSGDDEVEIDGKPVKVSALVEGYRKNSAAPVETPEQKAKREADEAAARTNAAPAETPEQKAKREADELAARNNAAAKTGVESFFTLRNARENAAAAAPASTAKNSGTISDRVRTGQEKYGSVVVVTGKN